MRGQRVGSARGPPRLVVPEDDSLAVTDFTTNTIYIEVLKLLK